MKNFRKYAYLASFGLLLSCAGLQEDIENGNVDHVDPYRKLNRDDYRDYMSPGKKGAGTSSSDFETKVETKVPPLPKISDILINPAKPKIGNNKTVSISVTEDVPLKDVFLELARLADVDIEVDPKITGGVIFKATNKPFAEVVERICNLAGLRYTENGGVLRIERDSPYVENYQASFLNVIRSSKGDINSNNKVLGSGGGSAASSSSNSSSSSGGTTEASGSGSSIQSKSGGEGDLWTTLEKEINAIIGTPAADAKAAAGEDTPYISLNREAGIISVKTSDKNHAKVKQYLDKVKDYYSSQVLIEAKVVEVALNDEFRSGVNWKILSGLGKGISVDMTSINGVPSPSFDATGTPTNITKIDLNRNSGDITAAVDLAQAFGTTRTLSSPRILVMNNQQAVLSFAKNQTYFSLDCTVTDAELDNLGVVTKPAKVDLKSTTNTIPVGVILTLQTAIDNKNDEVSMNIRPTLSRLTGVEFEDPAVSACVKSVDPTSTVTSKIPQVDVREMDSVLRLKSGEIMAIGGMIDQKDVNTDTGIPWLSEVPVLGNVFKTVDKQNRAVQTIIFLKATIVPGYGVDDKDRELYNKFVDDPHPLKF